MAHGHEDYYSGMVLYGVVSGDMVPINLDAGGNLVALLKAMYGTTPTTLACDADGNLNVNVAVALAAIGVEPKDDITVFKVTPDGGATIMKVAEQTPLTTIKVAPTDANPTFKVTPDGGAAIMKVAEQTPLTTIKVAPTDANPTFKVTPDGGAAIMKVAEQTPLTSIQVEPKSGMGNLKVDINAQTLSTLSTETKISTLGWSGYSTSITTGVNATIFNLTGKLRAEQIELHIASSAKLILSYFTWTIDGATINTEIIDGYRYGNDLAGFLWPLKAVLFDDVNFRYWFILNTTLRCNTSMKLQLYAGDGVTITNNCGITYHTL